MATSDASGASAEAMISVSIAAPAAAEPELPLVYEGQTDLRCTQCYEVGREASLTYQTGQDGLDATWIELAPGLDGRPFTAEASGGDIDVAFFDACEGAEVGYFAANGPEEGEVPTGATCLFLYNYNANDTTLTVNVYPMGTELD